VSLKGNASYIIDDETFEDATYEQLVARLKSRFGTEEQSVMVLPPVDPLVRDTAGHGLGRLYYLTFGVFVILVCYNIGLVINHSIIDKYLCLIIVFIGCHLSYGHF